MTLEEKFWQLFMIPGDLTDSTHDYRHGVFGLQIPAAPTARQDAERIDSVQRFFVERTRLGIPIIPFDEAVHGLTRPGATVFPQAIGLAATWDTALMGRVATAIARETRSRGIRQVLSPVVNLATDVRWGRTEETYGEDPLLASAMAAAYVAPFERLGVITTPKHFVANVGDGGRDSYPISLDDRTLAELYYPPFRAALAAGLALGHDRLQLGRRAPRHPESAPPDRDAPAIVGLPGVRHHRRRRHRRRHGAAPHRLHHPGSGAPGVSRPAWTSSSRAHGRSTRRTSTPSAHLVPPAVTDSAVARVLRAKAAIGLFADPYGNPDSAAYWNGHPSHRALAREAAAAAMVLLRNDGVLPLGASVPSVALIGVDAAEARLGGYTAPGAAPVSILAGLTARLGSRVRYAPGPGRESAAYSRVPTGRVALTAEFFGNPDLAGAPTATRRDSAVDVRWSFAPPAPGLGTDWYSVRWSGTLTAGPERVTRLGVDGTDGWRLWLDGRLLLDAWEKRSAGARLADVALAPGSTHALRLEFHETTGNAQFRLVWDTGAEQAARARLDSAVALARRSAVAVVVAGIEEGEFRDRARLGLPGYQEELIRRVAATGTPTVVVLVGGSAITMPWLDAVGAVLMAWYPGQEGGHAVADVLLGNVSPVRAAADHLSAGGRPAPAHLQPPPHRPRRRLCRPLRPAALPVRVRALVHPVLLRQPRDHAGGDRAGGLRRGAPPGAEHRRARGARGGAALPARRGGHPCPAGAPARGVLAPIARAGGGARGALHAGAGPAGGARRRAPSGGGAGHVHRLRGGVVARHPPPRHARGPLNRRARS